MFIRMKLKEIDKIEQTVMHVILINAMQKNLNEISFHLMIQNFVFMPTF